MVLFGITRDNVSASALGIGTAIGLGLGSMLVPILLSATNLMSPHFYWEQPNQSNYTQQQQEQTNSILNAVADIMDPLGSNVTVALTSAAISSIPHVSARGYLGVYLHALRQFPSGVIYSDWCTILVTALILIFLRLTYNWFWRPFEYKRGYPSNERLAAAFLRSAGDIPPGYPNTWFKVADSFNIPDNYADGAYRTDALGELLYIFRLPSVHPFGPDLKEGDVVTLVESSLNDIDPMKDLMAACDPKNNPNAIRWHTQEINKMIFIWHNDADEIQLQQMNESKECNNGSAPQLLDPAQPQWPIPLISGGMEGWRYHGSVTHEIACHLQEIPENGADNAHLSYIHGDFLLSWLGSIKHSWSAVWDTQPAPQAHVAKLKLTQHIEICGRKIPLTSLDSNIDQVGPALVQLIFPTPLGKVAVIETVTPIYHTLQRAQNVLWAEPTVPRFLAKVNK
jgi:cholesterol 7-dehydrogenase